MFCANNVASFENEWPHLKIEKGAHCQSNDVSESHPANDSGVHVVFILCPLFSGTVLGTGCSTEVKIVGLEVTPPEMEFCSAASSPCCIGQVTQPLGAFPSARTVDILFPTTPTHSWGCRED